MTGAARAIRFAVALALALCAGCGRSPAPVPPPAPPPYFRSVAAEVGVTFEHAQSRGGSVAYLPETLGPGVASLDYDGDGQQDLFFVQGSGPTNGQDPGTVPASHLYRNVERGERFEEIGAPSRAGISGWGQAALACDWNNDGYQDLLVTSYREPVLLLTGSGDGTFQLLRGANGLPAGDRWWSSATALDLDRDGLLDLYLGAYVSFGPGDWDAHPPMIDFSGLQLPRTMAPSPYRPEANAFLANRGDGRWEDRTDRLNLADSGGRTLAALGADLDRDGWMDLFVANDVSACALFHNVRGTPEEIAGRAWVAEVRGSMGLALGDPDRDGAFDIVCAHWVGDLPAYYRNVKPPGAGLAYQDVAGRSGLGSIPRDLVGWGVGFPDVDHDGNPDLLIVNGHTSSTGRQGKLTAQRPTLLLGKGEGRFQFWPLPAGPAGPLGEQRVGRGAAFTDLDGDGWEDVAVGVNNGRAEIWKSVGGSGHWIGAQLEGTLSNRNAIGATIEVADGAVTRHAQVTSGDSFFSSSDARVVIGLGGPLTGVGANPCQVRIRWPSGRDEIFENLPIDRYHRLVEGAGTARP